MFVVTSYFSRSILADRVMRSLTTVLLAICHPSGCTVAYGVVGVVVVVVVVASVTALR